MFASYNDFIFSDVQAEQKKIQPRFVVLPTSHEKHQTKSKKY